MKEANITVDAVCKTAWVISHKASADGQQADIVVGDGERIAFSIMSTPASKANPATIEEIERKVKEAIQQLQSNSNDEQEHSKELRVGINEINGAQEAYFSGKNGEHQFVVSSADYKEQAHG